MRKLILPVVVCGGLWMTANAASAQGFGVEVRAGPLYGYVGDEQRRYGRYYGYGYSAAPAPAARPYRSYDVYEEDIPARDAGSCGTFFYWDGDRCVDARNR